MTENDNLEHDIVGNENLEHDIAENSNVDWSQEYDELNNNPPKEGDILETMDDSKAILLVELEEGKQPFIYGCVFVPVVVGAKLGWFLQSRDGQGFHGFKCILMPRARAELIRREGLKNEVIEVTSLRVVRPSQTGKSLLCEVEKY